MSGLATAAIVVASVALYLWPGFMWALPRWVRKEMDRNITDYADLAERPGQIEKWRREEIGWGLPLALVWPLYLGGLAVTGALMRRIGPSPLEHERLMAQRAEHIRQLEEEAGIRPSVRELEHRISALEGGGPWIRHSR